MNFKVYIHTFPNGKVYIGQTKQELTTRWRADGKGYKGSAVVYNAIKKYGWENIKHEVIAEKLTLQEANLLEEGLIKKFDSTNHSKGYNVKFGGENTTVRESTKQKISNSLMGHPVSDKVRQTAKELFKHQKGNKHPLFGKKFSEEHIKNLRESHLGQKAWNRGLKGVTVAWNKGKSWSNESKQKMSSARQGRFKGKNSARSRVIMCVDTGEVFDNMRIAAEKKGIKSYTTISNCCRGLTKTASGYSWKYIEDICQ